jgi:hypothetical protein
MEGACAVCVLCLWGSGCGASDSSSDASVRSLPTAGGVADASAPLPPTVSADVEPSAVVSTAARVHVTSQNAVQVVVAWGDSPSLGQSTPPVPVPASGELSVPILGLAPAATNYVQVTAFGAGGDAVSAPPSSVTTGPLPPDLPAVTVESFVPDLGGVVLLGLFTTARGGPSWSVMVDRSGRILFYSEDQGSPRGLDFQLHPGGSLSMYRTAQSQFVMTDLVGSVLRHLGDPNAPLGADGHDIVVLDGGVVALAGWDQHRYDLTQVVDGGAPDALLTDTVVDVLQPDGTTQFHWAAYPDVQPSETLPGFDWASDPDFEHVNSLSRANDGDFLVSMRNTGTVYKIDRASGRIRWRLGGNRSDFTFVNDAYGGFTDVHFVRQLPDGDVLMLDNGSLHTPPISRAVQYRLDENLRSATLTWQSLHDPPTFEWCCGSVQRLPGGDTLIDWSTHGDVQQIDPFGALHWRLTTAKGELVYRAQWFASLYE